jgi:hypothetical protein
VPISGREAPRKEKMYLRLDKHDIKDEKKQILNQIKHKLSSASKNKLSKPASAREKKSTKKTKFIEELKEKYENQPILNGSASNRARENIHDEDVVDNDFLSVMSNLEKVLTSVGSKQKLKKELELINEKLKEFRLASDSEH